VGFFDMDELADKFKALEVAIDDNQREKERYFDEARQLQSELSDALESFR
jgi:hypothetical protein